MRFKVERFLNLIYYFGYRFYIRFSLFFDKINPFALLYKINFIYNFAKKRWQKYGYDDPIEGMNSITLNRKTGFSVIYGHGVTFAVLMPITLGLYIILSKIIFGEVFNDYYGFIIGFIIPTFIIHKYVTKDDKYLKYFEEFDKMPKKEKRKWSWITFFSLLGSAAFLLGSLKLSDYL